MARPARHTSEHWESPVVTMMELKKLTYPTTYYWAITEIGPRAIFIINSAVHFGWLKGRPTAMKYHEFVLTEEGRKMLNATQR